MGNGSKQDVNAGGVLRLAVSGAAGRMGARICSLAREDGRFEVVAEIDVDNAETAAASTEAIDAIVDFSADAGTAAAARLAVTQRAALVVGTTGLSQQTHQALDVAARSVPLIVAANTSIGVAVLGDLVVRAAQLIGDDVDISLIETHHVHKLDAPSGTALRLAALLRDRAGRELPPDRIHAVRGGDVVGEHTVEFAMAGERLQLTHLATSRDLFVRGALRAVAWLTGKPAGRYAIEEALGLEACTASR